MKTTLSVVCLLLIGALSLQAQDSVSVTFNVNMKVQIAKGAYAISSNSVAVRGSFNGWGETAMTDANNDSIYTVKIDSVDKSSTVNFKFYYKNPGDVWEGDPNRSVVLGTTDTVLAAVDFNREAMPSGAAAAVTFEINMKLPAKTDATFLTKKIYVAGNFTNWGTDAVQMTDANADSIYTVTDTINSATLIEYKFIHSADSAHEGSWETISNRKSWIVDGPQTISKNWDDVDPNVTLADGNILFQVDMSVMDEVGIYDPVKDSVRLFSSFNSWSAGAGQEAKWKMSQDFANPLLWTLNVPFLQTAVNGAYNFKYYVHMGDTTKRKHWTDGWERPSSQGGGNRDVIYQGLSNQQVALVRYDDVKTDYVIPNGTNLQVKFSVDMKPAALAPSVGFLPGVDTLYWLPEMPSFVYTQYLHDTTKWVDSDTMKVLKLTDANNDSIYEGTLSIYTPSFNTFVYRYAFKHGGTWTQEPGGFSDRAYRVRFIGQSAARTFPENPYGMPTDIWTNAEVKPDQELDPYTSLTLVRDEGNLIVSTYELYQNYPNPFNPATTIKFNLAAKQHVTLKIFNLLGQEVATLVNEELVPGAYTAKFDGGKLASGMYIYRITAGSYVEAKTMVMVK